MTDLDLGEIQSEFKPGLDNLIAGIIIGLLLIGGGIGLIYLPVAGVIESGGVLPFWTAKGEKGWSWGVAAGFVLFGVGLIIGGIFLIRWVRSLLSLRVKIGQNGFSVLEKEGTRLFLWENILSIQETHLHERPPILKGVAKYALPKTMSKSYVVKVKEHEPFAFDGTKIKGHSKLAKMIKQETDKRNIPWEVVDVQGY